MRNPKVDEYITKSAEFAVPILEFLRETIHLSFPGIVEEMKWSMPCFTYKKSMICNMAAFKSHCSFGFWLGAELPDPNNLLEISDRSGMGNFGKIQKIEDLPSTEIIQLYILNAIELVENGVKRAAPEKKEEKPIYVASDFPEIFTNNPFQGTIFDGFSPSKRREYIEWINEAKTDSTKAKRIATMLEWLLEGKTRNWKYEKC